MKENYDFRNKIWDFCRHPHRRGLGPVATKSAEGSHDADFVFRKDFLAQAEFQSSRINVLGAMHCIVVCRLVFADL